MPQASHSWRRPILALALALAAWSAAQAQSITPVWEYLISKLPSPLPILTNATPYTSDLDAGDGLSLMDCIGPMRRYDANRLLLGIRENGIDETDPNLPADKKVLAAAYPDRSLIWINPATGVPLGLALTVGEAPVPMDPKVEAKGGLPGGTPGAGINYYWSFDVSADGYVYTGYKNQMLRYAPNGSGGFNPTPTVVFTLDQDTATAKGLSEAQWLNFRWGTIRVSGTGANTKLLGCGVGPRGDWLLTTTDGNTFTAGSFRGGGWGNPVCSTSSLVPSKDPGTPDDLWFYGGWYPANSSGIDSTFVRGITSSPTDDFTVDGTFTVRADPNTNAPVRYSGMFYGGSDVHPDLDFMVAYSSPAYNHSAVGGYQPGWLALLGATNGAFLASHNST